MKRKLILLIIWILACANVNAKEYNASLFGVFSDGVTNNTASIQKAIDYINEQGGGTLVFYVGRYITGTVHLKSNVYIKLQEGAILVGAASPYEYKSQATIQGLVVAEGQQNIGISGKGVIEGNSTNFLKALKKLMDAGYVKKELRQSLLAFNNCSNVQIDSINVWDGAYEALSFTACKKVGIKLISVEGKNIPSSSGIVVKNCEDIAINDTFIKVVNQPLVSIDNQKLDIQNSKTNTGTSLKDYLK